MNDPDAPAIWMYWQDRLGTKRAPYLDLCMETVQRHAAGCRLEILDDARFATLAPDVADIAARVDALGNRSDLVRAVVLSRFGGLWLDVDVIALDDLRPLASLVASTDLAVADVHGSTWLGTVGGRASSPLLATWVDAQRRLVDDGAEQTWGFLGTPLLWSVVDRGAATDLHSLMPIGWREWRRFLSPNESTADVLQTSGPVIALWNEMMGPRLAGISRDNVLASNALVARLLRVGLGLDPVDAVEPTALRTLAARAHWAVRRRLAYRLRRLRRRR